MFDDEEDLEEGYLNEDLQRFESFLKGEQMGYLDSDRWEALIDHLMVNGQYKKAKTCTEEALAQFPFATLFKLRLAQALTALGELKDAVRLLNDLERAELPNAEIYLTKASVFSQLKDSENAIKYFKLAIKEADPEERDDIYLDLSFEYQNQGKYALALEVLKEAVRINPENEGAVYEMAFCYEQMGDYEGAVKCYTDFIDDNPYSFTAWYNLGNAYSRLEDFDQAIWAYDYSLLINEDFGPVYFNMGNALMNQNKYTKAIEHFNKCIALDGEDPIALCYLGECHEQLNELEQANHYYRKSLDLAPLLPDAWLGLGIVKDLEGDTRGALELLHKALDLDPDNAGIHHVLAGAYEKLEDLEQADEYYQNALALDPDDEECLTNYLAFLKQKSPLEAMNYIKACEALEMTNLILPILKVDILWALGEKQAAIKLFEQCVADDKIKANELFEINPELRNVQEFVHLTDNN